MSKVIPLILTGVLLSACEQEPLEQSAKWTDSEAPLYTPTQIRWYSREQVTNGAPLYAEHCASCHKANAEGSPNWKARDVNGNLPPPPLNGTAHAWHHPLDVLRRVVRSGGVRLGGTMPGFQLELSAQEIDAILAWVQSHWSDEIYSRWLEREMAAKRRAN